MKKVYAAQTARSDKQALDLATEMLLPPDATQVHGDVDRQVADVRGAKTKSRNLSAQLASAQAACKAALDGDTDAKGALAAALGAMQSMSAEVRKYERRVSVLAERAASNAAQCASLSMRAVAASNRPTPTALPAIVAASDAGTLIRDVGDAKGNFSQVDPVKHPRYAVRIGPRGDMAIGASTAAGPVVLRNGRPLEAYMATSTAHENAAPSSGPSGDRARANGHCAARSAASSAQSVRSSQAPQICSPRAAAPASSRPVSAACLRQRRRIKCASTRNRPE